MPNPRGRIFKLPMTITILLHKNKTGSFVAHALDFSLVSVMPTEKQAIEKLRFVVKTYIEFGLGKGWDADIMFPAPDKFWDQAAKPVSIGRVDPIMIAVHAKPWRVLAFEARIADEAPVSTKAA